MASDAVKALQALIEAAHGLRWLHNNVKYLDALTDCAPKWFPTTLDQYIEDLEKWLEDYRSAEIVDALKELVEAVDRITDLWDHTGTNMIDGYPQQLPSWDEFASDVQAWYSYQKTLRRPAK